MSLKGLTKHDVFWPSLEKHLQERLETVRHISDNAKDEFTLIKAQGMAIELQQLLNLKEKHKDVD